MNWCKEIRKISIYHDGELPPSEAQELAQHIQRCPFCRQELDRLRALSEWLSSAPAPDIPAAALDRMRRSVRPRRDRVILRTAKALTAAAAAVLLVCSALLWWGRVKDGGPIQPSAEPEQLAAVLALPESTSSDAMLEGDVGEDADVQLAQAILGPFSTGGERSHE